MHHKKTLVWFRQDLRIQDNPALYHAAQDGDVLCVYILDEETPNDWTMGGASKLWLHHSLQDLDQTLEGALHLEAGDPLNILQNLIQTYDIDQVFWNRCYEPYAIQRDKTIKSSLKEQDIEVQSFNASLLWEPWEISKKDGTPYKVFTPFYRKGCLGYGPPRPLVETPEHISFIPCPTTGDKLQTLNLIEETKDWSLKITKGWDITQKGAHRRLENFIKEGLPHYKQGRNTPSKPYVSRLSPYLHFGQISASQIWQTLEDLPQDIRSGKNVDHFKSELAWREFSYCLLYYNPDLPQSPLQERFAAFPWKDDQKALQAWQKGQTGIPIVDAGMRELWQTGFMHNRVRMIVGSFLVKNLLIHWSHGEKWFWDCLLDADLANNAASWQWIAGCGADTAPYFRIFNPISQAEKFDSEGTYIKTYLPELSKLPPPHLFAPWQAPALVLKGADVELGETYPHPIVDLKQSRNRALDAFASTKKTL